MGILNIDRQCQKQDKHIQLPTTALLLSIMKGFLFFTSSIAFVLGAPQFLSEQSKNKNCHTEVVTIFEESEAESVNKVICETEFRDSCVKKLENICNNVATGELECELVDRFNCVDSMTNKCGLESVLKNVSYTETVLTLSWKTSVSWKLGMVSRNLWRVPASQSQLRNVVL